VDHKFTFPNLAYDVPRERQPYYRLTFYFKKLPHVTTEQFHRHWEAVHADLFVGTKTFRDSTVVRYVQVLECHPL